MDNLLNWTRIQTGKIMYDPVNIELKTIVSEVLDFVASQAGNKQVACFSDISKDLVVFADINMLKTIIRNLVTNAVKYTSRGGNVRILAGRINDNVLIEIIDTGIGMSANRLKELFDGKKINSTPGTENEPGTGFGLILTQRFVEMNHGRMEVESTEGRGTTFRFDLPSGK